MEKRLFSVFILLAYIAVLIKVMVFKDIPLIRIGQMMLNFGGANAGTEANFIPFKTILPYLFGYKGLVIAGINLVGNVALLVPLGFLIPFVYPNMSWKKSIVLGVVAGLSIEAMQTVLGVVIGYFVFFMLTKWLREKKYIHILIATLLVIGVTAGTLYSIYPHGEPVINPRANSGDYQPERTPESGDLCGGTGGNGQITSIGNNSFTLQLNNGSNQTINLISAVEINTSAGPALVSDLKTGDRVTLVGGPNSDGTFTAEAVFVCSS